MSILSKLMGTAQGTATRGKTVPRGSMGRSSTGRVRTRGAGAATGTGRGFGRTSTPATGRRMGGRNAPAASGGLGKILGSLTGRR